ncbi:MAG: hypothetical protein ACQETH_03145 [Candidatus Rifleibacteriota bacterium]
MMQIINSWKFDLKSALHAIICLVLIFALPIMPVVASQPAYSSSKRPLTSFMKEFQNVSAEDLTMEKFAHKLYNNSGFTTGETGKPAEAGKKFYEAYKDKFEKLYKESGKILAELPKTFPPEKLKSGKLANGIDFRFSRSIVRCFQLVALYHFEQKDFQRAVKTLLLSNWFAHSIARGGGEPPSLIDLMISIAIRKIAVSELLWSSLARGEFSPKWLAYAEKSMAELETSQPAFSESLEWELTKTLSFTKKEMKKSNSELKTNKLTKNLSREKQTEIINKSFDIMNENHKRVLNFCTVYRLDPAELEKEMNHITRSLVDRGKFRITKILSPAKAVAQILEAMTMPNFSRAYDQYLQVRYLEKGTILLIRFLTRRKKGEPLPETLADFEAVAQARIPRDLYASDKSQCLYSVNKKWMTIYSIGRNRVDNKGDQEDDFILFKVPVKFINQL